MRHSIEPKDRIYVKDNGFISYAKNMSTYAIKIAENLSNKYSQKSLDTAKISTIDEIKLLQREQFKKQQKQLVI